MASRHDVGLYDRVEVDGKCCECGAPIRIRVQKHMAQLLEGAKEAVCEVCDSKSKWKRQRRCDFCDCFEGEHTIEYEGQIEKLVCKNCGVCCEKNAEG